MHAAVLSKKLIRKDVRLSLIIWISILLKDVMSIYINYN